MSSITVAIPSNAPGGVDAEVAMHFGHCDTYTIVKLENNEVQSVETLANQGHESGGCLVPVQHLADHGVNALLAGGMGMRPLNGFKEKGIQVYAAQGFNSVKQAITAFMDGKLQPFSSDDTCKGGGGHCHH